jgi:hypothetical protein
MSAEEWRFFKVRPGNYPTRRIAAMSYLLLRFKEKGLPAGLEELLKETTVDNGGRDLEQALLIAPNDYWGQYMDFGLPGGGVIPALLGRERATEIIVNVLLPFMFARGEAEGQTNPAEKAREIYRNYRAPAENTLEKHMRKQLGIGRYPVNTARRRQGLIHIYQTRCSQGKCDDCPIGRGY